MSADVLPFPTLATKTESEIPTPLYYQAGDEYVRLNVLTDELTEAVFRRGAVAIFLRGFLLSGSLHLLYLNGEPTVSRVFRSRRGRLRVGASPDSSRPVQAHEIEIVGSVSEFYPLGLSGPRLIIYQPDRAHLLTPVSYDRDLDCSLISAVAH